MSDSSSSNYNTPPIYTTQQANGYGPNQLNAEASKLQATSHATVNNTYRTLDSTTAEPSDPTYNPMSATYKSSHGKGTKSDDSAAQAQPAQPPAPQTACQKVMSIFSPGLDLVGKMFGSQTTTTAKQPADSNQ